jgi:nicotinamidase-related amidase
MTIDLDRAVLLPIDVQQAFDAPPWPRRWNQQVDANGLALLAAWRSAGRPIIHVRHDSTDPGSSLAPRAPGNAFRPGFGPTGGEPLVTKSVHSAFIGTDLDIELRQLGARHVVVFGIATDMCVSTTIRMGANLGWDMVLVADACDCFDALAEDGAIIPAEEMQRAHVATLALHFARAVSTADLTEVRAAA